MNTKFQSTLPQGERRFKKASSRVSARFQSTLPQGERRQSVSGALRYKQFQSTLPQGERHLRNVGMVLQHYDFNPRSHKGSDATEAAKRAGYSEFQSTLPQGERQQFYTKFHICFISFLPILSPYHISTHSPLPTFNHFLYIFSGANRPGISCLLPFRTKTISGIL